LQYHLSERIHQDPTCPGSFSQRGGGKDSNHTHEVISIVASSILLHAVRTGPFARRKDRIKGTFSIALLGAGARGT
jgi:hypothetical protein